jgi:hypothetical protein
VTELERYLGMPAAAATHRVLERARRYVEQETPSSAAGALTRLAGTIEQE